MHVVWRAHRSAARLSGALCLVSVVALGALAVAGCGSSSGSKAATVRNCGTSRTAANVPIEVHVYKTQISCSTALAVEASYAKAIVEGKAPGNGGGGPVVVSGWTCEGFSTPEVLKTGDTSKCLKAGAEILATLKTTS